MQISHDYASPAGVSSLQYVSGYLGEVSSNPYEGSPVQFLWSPTARAAGLATMAYHGYKRTKSAGWAILWAIGGYLSPPVAGAISLAQGYGKRK